MATTVYNVEEVTLQDDTQVTLKPLNIKSLRKFMKKLDEFGDIKDGEDGMDVILDLAALCLSKQRPEFYDFSGREGKGAHTEVAEEAFDMPTAYKVIEVMGGVKLNDPKLMEAAMEMANEAQAVGTN